MSIELLEIPIRVSSKLISKNIMLVGDLIILTEEEVTKNLGIEKDDLAEILEVLASRGLTLGMHLTNWVVESEMYRWVPIGKFPGI
jgi:DNA-directed RNA polymerase subunit alpha